MPQGNRVANAVLAAHIILSKKLPAGIERDQALVDAIRQISGGICIADIRARLIHMDISKRRFFGASDDQMLGSAFRHHVIGGALAPSIQLANRDLAISSGKVWVGAETLWHRPDNGDVQWYQPIYVPMANGFSVGAFARCSGETTQTTRLPNF